MVDVGHIEGLEGIIKSLNQLPKELVGKNGGPIRKALVAASTIIRDDARARVSALGLVKTGAMQANIAYQVDRNPQRSGANERVRVGVRGGALSKYADTRKNRRLGVVGKAYEKSSTTFYWRFHEFGTEKMKAQPFLRPAFESNTGAALDTIVSMTERQIAIIARRLARENSRTPA